MENVFFGDEERGVEAPRGAYKVFVENYAYHEAERDVPVPFRVIVRKNGEATEYTGATPAGLTQARSRVEVVNFTYAGRTARLPLASDAPSALEASNLVAVTASVGSTLDALRGLMALGAEVAEIESTRALLDDLEDLDEPMAASTEPAEDAGDGFDEAWAALGAGDAGDAGDDAGAGAELLPDVIGDAVMVTSQGAELPAGRQPAVASRSRFEVTSRDRLYLQLAKLPPRFHQEVAAAFGGDTLLEMAARDLAKRLHESRTPVSALRANGYPAHIVEMIKRLMATGGTSAGSSAQ